MKNQKNIKIYGFKLKNIGGFEIQEPETRYQDIYRRIRFTFSCTDDGKPVDYDVIVQLDVANSCLEQWGKDRPDEWKKYLYGFLRKSKFGLFGRLKKGLEKEIKFILENGSLAATVSKLDCPIGDKFSIKVSVNDK